MPAASRITTVFICLLAALSAAPTPARAQDYGVGPHTYYLHQPSSYQQGCWGDCACPLTNEAPMLGRFTLTLITVGNASDFYTISDVAWRVPTIGGQPFNVAINGSGMFTVGQHPLAFHQYMSLDLTLSPAPSPWSGVQQFSTTPETDTRTVPPPVIYLQLANSESGCPGIRVWVAASQFRADVDLSGTITVADIFAFINAWFAGSAYADFNGNGGVNGLEVQDIFDFLGAWFAGT